LKRIRDNYAAIAATVALVVALTGVGAQAASILVTSNDIKNGSVKSVDIANSGVRSADIKASTIKTSDIGSGQVQPSNLSLPAPADLQSGAAQLQPPPSDLTQLAVIGPFTKEDPNSIVKIEWTGSVQGRNEGEAGGCVFQIRVDGQKSPAGGGEVFGGPVPASIASTVLFPGLPAGPHTIEVWAKGSLPESPMGIESGDRCVIGPAIATVPQSFVVSEEIV
jgi:hypothetical protein